MGRDSHLARSMSRSAKHARARYKEPALSSIRNTSVVLAFMFGGISADTGCRASSKKRV